jgi:hypothetical protein
VESASRVTMRRPNSVLLKDNSTELYFAFESKEEKSHWMDMMNQVMEGPLVAPQCSSCDSSLCLFREFLI